MDEIKSVEPRYKGKKTHFGLRLSSGKKMHLKCDKEEDSKEWVEALTALMNVYKNKDFGDFDTNRQYKDKVDIRIINLIMQEIEGINIVYSL